MRPGMPRTLHQDRRHQGDEGQPEAELRQEAQHASAPRSAMTAAWVGNGAESRPPAGRRPAPRSPRLPRSEEHTSELQSLMRISYAVFCLKKKHNTHHKHRHLTVHKTHD